jgi:hypothetical protein
MVASDATQLYAEYPYAGAQYYFGTIRVSRRWIEMESSLTLCEFCAD